MSVKKLIQKIKCFGCTEVEKYRKLGVKIGTNVHLYGAKIDYEHGFLVEIGDNVTITHSMILAHDASTKKPLGYSKIGKVIIGNNVFVGYGSIILAGVVVGDNVIIGAGSVVRESIPPNSVVCGNPAGIVCATDEYLEKNRKRLETAPVFKKTWEEKTSKDIEEMQRMLQPGEIGFDV